MSSVFAFWSISLAIALGAMSPGPSFVMVAKSALSSGRRSGILTALGMGFAGLLYATLAVFGLAALLNSAPPLFIALRVFGATYLAFIGVSMIRHARKPLTAVEGQNTARAGLWLGFRTQISNPKTVVVYASVFASLMPHSPEPWLFGALPAAVGLIEGVWYVVVASVFSTKMATEGYVRAKSTIDRIAGAIMIALALKLSIG